MADPSLSGLRKGVIRIEQPQTAENVTQETSQVEAPTTETTTTESTEQPVEAEAETTVQQPEVKKSSRAEKRLHQLLEKKEERQEAQIAPQQGLNYPTFQPQNPWYQPQVQPGQEITPDQYKADVTRSADDIAQLRINQFRQEQATERAFDRTVNELEREYPALNPDAEGYNEKLAEKVAGLYQKTSRGVKNPNLLKDIADSIMDLSSQARTEGQSAVTNQLVRQASEAAISPTGSQKVSTDFEAASKIKDPKARQKALEKILPVA